jgi:hypothetical protein
MNERIKKLAEQAGSVYQKNLDVYLLRHDELENFAELIVKECVTIINHGIDHTDYPHPNDTEKSMVEMKAQMWCRDAIKEHFGVK